jgi:hypothetical protein
MSTLSHVDKVLGEHVASTFLTFHCILWAEEVSANENNSIRNVRASGRNVLGLDVRSGDSGKGVQRLDGEGFSRNEFTLTMCDFIRFPVTDGRRASN